MDMKAPIFPLCLFVILLAPVGALAEDPPARTLPEGVAALVGDEVITMAEFKASLVERFAKTDAGREALEAFVEGEVVRREALRRGVEVSTAEVDAYVAKTERDVIEKSMRTQTLADLLKQEKTTMAEFRKFCRDLLARQKMARQDTGIEGEISQGALGVWLLDLKSRLGVVVGGPSLPAGVHARIGNYLVTDAIFADRLLDALGEDKLESALWDVAISVAVRQRLAADGVKIEPADVEDAIEGLRDEFEEDPRFQQTNLKFEQYVEAVRKLTLDELRRDPLFLAQVGLAKTISRRLTADEIRTYWEENRDRYGEQRTFIHLLIRADDRRSGPFGGGSRSYAEAKEMIDAVYVRLLRGTPFERLVNEASEDRDKFKRPDRQIPVTKASALPDAWKKAVFDAPVGEVVGPIRSPFGYHLLKVIEVRPDPGFERSRDRIARDLVRERRTSALLEIRQDPGIVIRY